MFDAGGVEQLLAILCHGTEGCLLLKIGWSTEFSYGAIREAFQKKEKNVINAARTHYLKNETRGTLPGASPFLMFYCSSS